MLKRFYVRAKFSKNHFSLLFFFTFIDRPNQVFFYFHNFTKLTADFFCRFITSQALIVAFVKPQVLTTIGNLELSAFTVFDGEIKFRY